MSDSYINDLIEVTGTYAAQYLPTPLADRPSTGCVLPSLTSLASALTPPSPPSDIVDTTCCAAPFIPFPLVPAPFSPPENCPSGINISGTSSLTVTSGGVPVGSPISLYNITNPVDVCHWIISGSPTLEIGSLVPTLNCPNTSPVFSDTVIQIPNAWDAYGHATGWITAPSGLSGSATSSTLLSSINRAGGVVSSVTGGTFSGLSAGSIFTCTLSGGAGSGALVTAAYLTSTSVTWSVVNSGSGYTSAPTLTVTITGSGGTYTASSATVTITTGCNLELNLPTLTIPCYPNGPRFNGSVSVVMADSTSVGSFSLSPEGTDTGNPSGLPCIFTFGNPILTIPVPSCTGGTVFTTAFNVQLNGTSLPNVSPYLSNFSYTTGTTIIENGYYWTSSSGTTGNTPPAWSAATYTDGTVTWTRYAAITTGYNSIGVVDQNSYYRALNIGHSPPNPICGSVLIGTLDLGLPTFVTNCPSGFSVGSTGSVSILTPVDTGYSAPNPTHSGGNLATATATVILGKVTSVAMTAYGLGYGLLPSIDFSTYGGGGSGATAYSEMGSGGSIAEVVVTTPGSGYLGGGSGSFQVLFNGGPVAPISLATSTCGFQFSAPSIDIPVNNWPCQSGYTVNGSPISNTNNSIAITNVYTNDSTPVAVTQTSTPLTITSTPCGIAISGTLTVQGGGGGGGGGGIADAGYAGEYSYSHSGGYTQGQIVRVSTQHTGVGPLGLTVQPGLYAVIPGQTVASSSTVAGGIPQYADQAQWHCLVQYCTGS